MEGLVTLITLAVLLEAAVEWFKDVVYGEGAIQSI